MKFKRTILTSLIALGSLAPLSNAGAQDVEWGPISEGAAHEMAANACRGTVPAFTESGWFPAGSGWINATVRNCVGLRMDYHASDGTWYPAVILASLIPECVPNIEMPQAPGLAAILTFKSLMNNEGCMLSNTPWSTQFRVYHVTETYAGGWIVRSFPDQVYMYITNMVDGLNASESWIQISIGN